MKQYTEDELRIMFLSGKPTKYDVERFKAAKRYNSNEADSGRNGRIHELEKRYAYSKRTKQARDVSRDDSIRFRTEEGKIVYYALESKTSGGRVDSLISGLNKSKFIVYSMHFIQKHKATKTRPAWNEEREIDAVVIPTELFLSKLYEFKAIKTVNHNGKPDGLAIQVSNLRWFEWLLDYPIMWDREAIYCVDDFEGLE